MYSGYSFCFSRSVRYLWEWLVLTAVAAIVPTFAFTTDAVTGKGATGYGLLSLLSSDSVLLPASDAESSITKSPSGTAYVPKAFALKNSSTYGLYSLNYVQFLKPFLT